MPQINNQGGGSDMSPEDRKYKREMDVKHATDAVVRGNMAITRAKAQIVGIERFIAGQERIVAQAQAVIDGGEA